MEIIFWSGTKSLGLAQYVNPLTLAQKVWISSIFLGPVEGQGILEFG
jgi:hypothetical protein